MYTLYRSIFVDTAPEKAWEFIRNPANLDRITPDDMNFEIVSELPNEMVEGMLVEYRIRIPLIGRQTWVSELKHIQPYRSFVDEQKIGPYRFWYHYHGIEAEEGGVRLVDRVSYAVPFGVIGRLAHALFIRKTLARIFNFRETAFRKELQHQNADADPI